MPNRLRKLPVVVLASGRGSNFRALLNRQSEGDAEFQIGGLICNRPQAPVVAVARKHAIPINLIDDRTFTDREAFDAALDEQLRQYPGHLIVLAGFMRILGDQLVNRYSGRMINLHPSLLPKYTGLHTHKRVLESGDAMHGASIHFVVPKLDAGPVISRVRLRVPEAVSPDELAALLQPLEHQLLIRTVELFALQRIQWRHDSAYLDNEPLKQAIEF